MPILIGDKCYLIIDCFSGLIDAMEDSVVE